MANITIGQYYPENSIIHKLDPRVKLFGTMVFIVMLFLLDSVPGYILFTVFMAAIIKASKVPFGKLLKGVRAILFIYFLVRIERVYDTGRRIIFNMGINSNKRRLDKSRFYSNKTGLSGNLYFGNDTYNNTK